MPTIATLAEDIQIQAQERANANRRLAAQKMDQMRALKQTYDALKAEVEALDELTETLDGIDEDAGFIIEGDSPDIEAAFSKLLATVAGLKEKGE